MRLFDTHCHLDFPLFSTCFEQQLQRAMSCGVDRYLIPATSPERWANIIALANRYPNHMYYALGVHPHFIPQLSIAKILQQLEQQMTSVSRQCVALGECGLDAMIDEAADRQESLLLGQLAMAQSLQCPVILHSRKTHQPLIRLIKQVKFAQGGVLHAFSGSQQEAQQFIDLGFKLGVGGVITYPRANKTRQTFAQVNVDHLVLETDAPDMPLAGFQGQANHPSQLPLILQALAELKDCDAQWLAEKIWQQSLAVFRLEGDEMSALGNR